MDRDSSFLHNPSIGNMELNQGLEEHNMGPSKKKSCKMYPLVAQVDTSWMSYSALYDIQLVSHFNMYTKGVAIYFVFQTFIFFIHPLQIQISEIKLFKSL